MKYTLYYYRIWNKKSEICYVKGFLWSKIDWKENGRFSNADHFNISQARYLHKLSKQSNFIQLYIKPVNY